MNQLTIDGVVYKLDALSDAARQQVSNLQVTDAEIDRLQSLLAIARTARAAYVAALRNELPAAVCH
jgi:septum formation topological specificity factor MinE